MSLVDGSGFRLLRALDVPAGDVHVWSASVDVSDAELNVYRNQLSTRELHRAAQFRFLRDRARFIARHGLLRALLGRYLGIPPHQLRFCYGQHGKPALAGPCSLPLKFNLSHSDGLALYAISRTCEVGIDVERVREEFPWQEVVGQVLSIRERAGLFHLPPALRRAAFYTSWTRKEAFLKATSQGFADPLDRFDVSWNPEEPVTLLERRVDASAVSRWSLYDVSPGASYVGALAVQSR